MWRGVADKRAIAVACAAAALMLAACKAESPTLVIAFDAQTGQQKWHARVDGDYADDMILFDTETVEVNGYEECSGNRVGLAAFDLENGSRRTPRTRDVVDLDDEILLNLIVTDDLAANTQTTDLVAVDKATGLTLWQDSWSNEWVKGSIAGDLVLVSVSGGWTSDITLTAREKESGETRWSVPIPQADYALSMKGVEAASAVIPIDVSGNGGLDYRMGLDSSTGGVVWQIDCEPDEVFIGYGFDGSFRATVHGDRIVAPEFDRLGGYDLATGQEVWAFDTQNAYIAALDGDDVFVAKVGQAIDLDPPAEGRPAYDVSAVRIGDGAELWSSHTEDPIRQVAATGGFVAELTTSALVFLSDANGAVIGTTGADLGSDELGRSLVASGGVFVLGLDRSNWSACD